jgi:hypothetical protein
LSEYAAMLVRVNLKHACKLVPGKVGKPICAKAGNRSDGKVYLRERKTQRKPTESLKVRPTFEVGSRLGIRRFAFAPVKAGKNLKAMRTMSE